MEAFNLTLAEAKAIPLWEMAVMEEHYRDVQKMKENRDRNR